MSGSTLPQAFKLVRTLLSERPRAFQEILRDGLPAATTTTTTATATVKGKGKLVAGESHVPDGHPFVSASYLKTRILPILSSQGLIAKSKSKSKGSHTYTLPTPILENHWTRLESGESPSMLGYEYTSIKAALADARKEARAVEDGTAEERLVWYRNSKEMGRLAVPLDRGYLNRRKSKKRYGSLKDREGKLELLTAGAEPWEVRAE